MEQSSTPSPAYEQIRDSLTPLLELPEEEYLAQIDDLIKARLTELESAPPKVTQLDGLHGNYQSFLHPSIEVMPLVHGTGFRLDDPLIYGDLLKNLFRFNKIFGVTQDSNEEEYQRAIFQAIQYALQDYFENVRPGNDDLLRREEMVSRGAIRTVDIEDEKYTPASIAEMKKIALCAERTAVANNMLQFLGFEPVLVQGKLGRVDHEEELHAFLVIRNGKGEEMIYDPTNPFLVFDQQGRLVQTSPALYHGDGLLSKQMGVVEATKLEYKIGTDGKAVLEKEKPYKYINTLFGSELHPN